MTPDHELLSAYNRLGARYLSGLTLDPRLPPSPCLRFQTDADEIQREMAQELAETAEQGFISGLPPSVVVPLLGPGMQRGAKRLSALIAQDNLDFRSFLSLQRLEETGAFTYLFLSVPSAGTCETCAGLNGAVLTLPELSEKNLFPPLHPNCRCVLIALDRTAGTLYSRNWRELLPAIQKATSSATGGIYLLKYGSPERMLQTLRAVPLHIADKPAIQDNSGVGGWWRKLSHWAFRFKEDAKASWDAFYSAQEERGARALESVPSFLDWLTYGSVSGYFQLNQLHYAQMKEEPSLYTVANWLLSGLPDQLKNTFAPEEPLSFDHWMASLGTATLLFGAYRLYNKSVSADKPRRLPDFNPSYIAQESDSMERPTWRQSELDAAADYPGYEAQQSFLNGEPVDYGTKGSVRPDYYCPGHSVDVKNYDLSTASGQSRLVRNITQQYIQRLTELPPGTQQTFLIDIRGQVVSQATMTSIMERIFNHVGQEIEILFKKRN